MRLTKKQELAVKNGQPVRVRKEGLDCVVIRGDLYDRAAMWLENDSPSVQTQRSRSNVGARRDALKQSPRDRSEPWTEEQDDRRCELIDKDIEGTISLPEKLELERLQERFHEYLDTVAPPPIEGALRLHRQLLEKKRQHQR